MASSAAVVKTDVKTELDSTIFNNSPKILYIPQGFSGRLTLDSAFYGIEGLYLDDFSICNILVCVSKDRTRGIACHIDQYTCKYAWDKIKEELDWVGEEQEFFLLTRPEGLPIKTSLLSQVTIN